MKRPLSHRAGLLALVGVFVAAASGCSDSGGDTTASGEVPDKVVLTLRNDVDTFDPFLSQTESGAKQVFDAIYDTLVRIGTSDGKVTVKPSMATKWDVTPDSATFTLRDGLTCGDGTPLSASGIAESLKHMADPETGAGSATRVFGPAGVDTITSDDAANTISIKLKAPYTLFLQNLAAGAYIVCPSALKDLKTLAGTPASTGPYTVAKLQRGESYVLKRRDTPVVAKADLPAEITMRVVANDTTRANLVDTGQVDISSLLGRDAERLKGKGDPIMGPAALSTALLFNQAPGLPGADKNLRTAFAHAVDASAYAKAATYGLGV
jgi:peptide/nickel transport system substrate-binding protein